MSIVAICPINQVVQVNVALDGMGFGPKNFVVPLYTGAEATHAVLHCWPNEAFQSALEGIGGVSVEVGTTYHIDRVQDMVGRQGAAWGGRAEVLPSSGTVTAGKIYIDGEDQWIVLQPFDRSVFSASPETYPALIRRVRNPHEIEPWIQPIDQYDSYRLVNQFTGLPDAALFDGVPYQTTVDFNVWSLSAYPAGWAAK